MKLFSESAANTTEGKKTFRQMLLFILVSFISAIIQLGSVNLPLWAMKGWTAPLPDFLQTIFNEHTVGAGNDNWGYVLPFLSLIHI